MRTGKTTFGTRTKITTSVADLGSVVRLNSNNFNSSMFSFILDKKLQLVKTPITNPIVHNSPSMLFSYTFEIFHNNLVSVEIGNNIFTDIVVNPNHKRVFPTAKLFQQSLSTPCAFGLKFTTQIFEFSFNLLDFGRIIKPAIRTDSKVIYSKVNTKNSSLRATVHLSSINLFRECEYKETSSFFIHSKQTFFNFPTEVIFITSRNSEFELLPYLEQPQNEDVSFDVSTSWEVVSNRSSFDNWLGFSFLDHSTGLFDTNNSKLGWQFESSPNNLIDRIMQFEVVIDFMFPSIINTELKGFSICFDSSNYLFSWINLDFSTYSCSHKGIEPQIVFKTFGNEERKGIPLHPNIVKDVVSCIN